MKLPIHVVCGSPEAEAKWRSAEEYLGDVSIIAYSKGESASEAIGRMVAGAESAGLPYAVFCSESALLGRGFGQRTLALAAELERHASGLWGVAGNSGVLFDGQTTVGFSFPAFGFGTSRHPKAVAWLDDGVLLLNLAELHRRGLRIPPAKGSDGISILLSLESIRLGLACLVDARLFAVQQEAPSDAVLRFLQTRIFTEYYARHFRTSSLPHRASTVDFSRHLDFNWLDLTPDGGDRVPCGRLDVWSSAEACARSICKRMKPSITVVCRTTHTRPAQLARAIRSFAAAQARSTCLEARVLVLSTVPDQERMDAEVCRLKALAPQLNLAGEFVPCPAGRASRAHLMTTAFEKVTSDYLWFVDDDDFLFANALAAIEPYMNLGKANLLIGDTAVFEEHWVASASSGGQTLRRHRRADVYRGANFTQCLSGENVIPNCGMIYPVQQVLPRLRALPCLGDQYEDHFLHALALSSPDAEAVVVPRILAGISRAGAATTAERRSGDAWNRSLASFMGDLLNKKDGASPLFWQLAGMARAGGVGKRSRSVVQVFMPRDGRYSEADSIIHTMEDGDAFQSLRYRVTLKDPSPIRIDIGNTSGYAEIRAIRLLGDDASPSAGTVLWSCNASNEFSGLEATPSVSIVGRPSGGNLRLFLWGMDPQIHLKVPPGLQGTGEALLELELRYIQAGQPGYQARMEQDLREALAGWGPGAGSGNADLQLFTQHVGGWSEANSAKTPLRSTGSFQRYRLSVHLNGPKGLRLDIGNVPGVVHIRELVLLPEEGGTYPQASMRWNAEAGFGGVTALNDVEIGDCHAKDGLVLRLTGIDPQLFLSMGDRKLQGRFVFEADLRYRI